MNKQEIKAQAKSSIDAIFDQIEKMERESVTILDNMKSEVSAKKDFLKKQQKEVKMKYHNLKNATAESVEEANRAFNESKRILQTAIDEVAEKLLKV